MIVVKTLRNKQNTREKRARTHTHLLILAQRFRFLSRLIRRCLKDIVQILRSEAWRHGYEARATRSEGYETTIIRRLLLLLMLLLLLHILCLRHRCQCTGSYRYEFSTDRYGVRTIAIQ